MEKSDTFTVANMVKTTLDRIIMRVSSTATSLIKSITKTHRMVILSTLLISSLPYGKTTVLLLLALSHLNRQPM